ncbi:MAG: hypothetical protein EZS28_038116, partial [Streblomastix strix]
MSQSERGQYLLVRSQGLDEYGKVFFAYRVGSAVEMMAKILKVERLNEIEQGAEYAQKLQDIPKTLAVNQNKTINSLQIEMSHIDVIPNLYQF